ncbi:MAG: hypothetical protein QG567_2003 [Campylobacterota bacterium]|nr:hypothetical protein [Campylobacterota bacterium]
MKVILITGLILAIVIFGALAVLKKQPINSFAYMSLWQKIASVIAVFIIMGVFFSFMSGYFFDDPVVLMLFIILIFLSDYLYLKEFRKNYSNKKNKVNNTEQHEVQKEDFNVSLDK